MNAVKVEYKVRPEFVDQNKANIRRVMAALRSNPIEGLKYVAFIRDDDQTFIHLNITKDETTLAEFTEMAEFKAFQKELRESDPVSPPSPEKLNLVDAGFEI